MGSFKRAKGKCIRLKRLRKKAVTYKENGEKEVMIRL